MLTKFQTDWMLSGEFEEFNVDEYRIVDILGTGGMGWLYVGVNENTGEKAAVKVISKMMENDYLTRFKLEARAGLTAQPSRISCGRSSWARPTRSCTWRWSLWKGSACRS